MTVPSIVALVGEDNTHAVLLGMLLRASIREAAEEAGRPWIVDNLTHDPIFHGHEDLGHVVAGLRYTSSLRFDLGELRAARIGGSVVKLRGMFGGVPQEPEAHRWRLVLTLILSSEPEPEVVLVARDTDGDRSRLAGLRQVAEFLTALDPDRAIVLAAPHRDAESWFVAGFKPEGQEELAAHAVSIAELGFDPCRHPEDLTAHPNHAKTDAKRVLRSLLKLPVESRALTPDELRDNHGRLLGDLGRLRQRGSGTGLVDFLAALQQRVVPRFVPGA